jgi:hypothetical protein
VSSTVSGIVNNTALQELGGVDKLINGVRIGRGAGNIVNNTVLGNNALNSNTTGSNIIALGNSAGSQLISGNNNIIIGSQAQPSSPTVSNEITLGNENTTKQRIPGIGFEFSSNSIKFTDGSVQSSAARGIFD